MTIQRVLVAVDDSPPRRMPLWVGVELATDWHVRLRLVTVATDHALGALLDTAAPDGGATERIDQASRSVLRHLTDTA